MIQASIPNALTVDLEDYFHVSAFDRVLSRSSWNSYDSRVEIGTEKLLRIFDEAGVRATFFVLGWVARKRPDIVKRIADEGHEIASHGFWHHLVYEQSPEQFASDIADSKTAIGDATGIDVTAYRAPSFSITKKSRWAIDVLIEQGFRIDSSIFPINGHHRYGWPKASREIHTLDLKSGSICEFPPSAWSRGRVHVPIGGGYFRLFPFELTCKAVEAVRRQGRPAMFYTHPWEFDPEQPRVQGLGLSSRSRHYVGLKRTESRMRRLLTRFKFGTLSDVLTASRAAGLEFPSAHLPVA